MPTKKAAPKKEIFVVTPSIYTNGRGANFDMLQVATKDDLASAKTPVYAGLSLSVNKWRKILTIVENPAVLKKLKAACK